MPRRTLDRRDLLKGAIGLAGLSVVSRKVSLGSPSGKRPLGPGEDDRILSTLYRFGGEFGEAKPETRRAGHGRL